MNLYTIDFETYYSQDYSLSNSSTEEYVLDPRFEVILVGIKLNDEKPYFITGTSKYIGSHLSSLNLEQHAVLCHNSMFDVLILAEEFGIRPKMIFDSLQMAQAVLKPLMRSISLDSCTKKLPLGILKGNEVHNMKGRTRQSLSQEEMQRYGEYCMTDCEAEYRLFKHLLPQFPRSELQVMHSTLHMYLEPKFELDETMLLQQLQLQRAKQQQVLNALPTDIVKADLMSNPKFAEILERYGVEPPVKISPTTGQVTYAFARTDTAWKELEEEYEDDLVISSILKARISAKSTLEESRLQRLVDIAKRKNPLRVAIRYYAAHTGRDGGTEGINLQNLPRIDKSRMRFALRAPKGMQVLAADLAQIEARITAWFAGQLNLLEGFRNKEDIYANFATIAFGIDTLKGRSPEDNKRRFVGKTCILGLGFGMSVAKLRATLRKDGVKISLEEGEKLVRTYRNLYKGIPALWTKLGECIEIMATNSGRAKIGPVTIARGCVVLPNGMSLVYNNLRKISTPKYSGWVYDFAGETRTLWGGKLAENIVQALARIMIMDYMIKIKHTLGFYPALRQHDELDYIVLTQYADKVARAVGKMMRVPPLWAPDLPVEVEINYGDSLGDCK